MKSLNDRLFMRAVRLGWDLREMVDRLATECANLPEDEFRQRSRRIITETFEANGVFDEPRLELVK
jgi:hypothetical protein